MLEDVEEEGSLFGYVDQLHYWPVYGYEYEPYNKIRGTNSAVLDSLAATIGVFELIANSPLQAK